MIECISLWQPWASLIFTTPPVKTYETRSFPAPARVIGKRIGIHAAQKIVQQRNMNPELLDMCDEFLGLRWPAELPRGCLVGTVEVEHVIRTDYSWSLTKRPYIEEDDLICGDWTPNRFGWKLINPIRYTVPIPCRGQQGWWKIGEDLFGPLGN